jgi:ribonuclease Y
MGLTDPHMTDIILSLLAGGILSGVLTYVVATKKNAEVAESAKREAAGIVREAEDRSARIREESSRRAEEERRKLDEERQDARERQKKIEEIEARIAEKDERIDKKLEELDRRQENLRDRERELSELKDAQERLKDDLRTRLAEVSKLDEKAARELLLKQVEDRYERDILGLIEKKRSELKVREREISQEILVN